MQTLLNFSQRIRNNILILLLFVLLSLAMTYPLILNIKTHVPGVPGDNFAYLWKVWWFKKAIVDLHRNPLFAPHILYPLGFNFARDEATISNTLLSVPLTSLLGHILSYNIMLLLTYILAGFGMYLLVFYLTRSIAAGIVSGVIFAFAPYHQMRALQHLNLATIQWIPFLFLYVEKFLRELRVKYALAAGIFYALTALAAWYYAYYVGLTLAIYLAIRLFKKSSETSVLRIEGVSPACHRLRLRPMAGRQSRSGAGLKRPTYPNEEFFNDLVKRTRQLKTLWKDRRFLRGVLIFFIVSLILVLPFAVPSFMLHSTGVMKYKLIDVDPYSASLEDFFVPASFHTFWGAFFHRNFGALKVDWSEHMLYLGIIPLLLAIFAVRKRGKENMVLASAWLALITFIFALGTTFHIFGERVLVKNRFFKSFIARETLPIPLPMLLLFLVLPFISSTRVWSRFGVMTMFFVAILAGWGTVELTAAIKKYFGQQISDSIIQQFRFKKIELLLGFVLVFLILLDFTGIPLPMSKVEQRPVDIWLGKMKEQFTIIQLPDATQGPQLLYTVYHKKRIANGCGAFLPPQFNVDLYGLKSLPDPNSIQILRRMGVKYLLLNQAEYGKTWKELSVKLKESRDLQKVRVFGNITVFRVIYKERI